MSEQDTTNPSAADVELFDFYVAQLEAYLDGELDTDEASEVRRRLMQEEAYAAALGRLHAQRVQRVEIFRHIEKREVADESAARLAASARRLAVAGAAGNHAWPTWVKLTFGMAACLLVGFAGGMIGVYDFGKPPSQPTPSEYESAPGSASDTRWILMHQGKPVMELPAGDQPFQELNFTPDRPPQTPR